MTAYNQDPAPLNVPSPPGSTKVTRQERTWKSDSRRSVERLTEHHIRTAQLTSLSQLDSLTSQHILSYSTQSIQAVPAYSHLLQAAQLMRL